MGPFIMGSEHGGCAEPCLAAWIVGNEFGEVLQHCRSYDPDNRVGLGGAVRIRNCPHEH